MDRQETCKWRINRIEKRFIFSCPVLHLRTSSGTGSCTHLTYKSDQSRIGHRTEYRLQMRQSSIQTCCSVKPSKQKPSSPHKRYLGCCKWAIFGHQYSLAKEAVLKAIGGGACLPHLLLGHAENWTCRNAPDVSIPILKVCLW
jgi:hypothetical protein